MTKLRSLSLFVLAFLLVCAADAFAQSSDQNLPAPVLTNEINGTINALDLGDSRQTRHFYAFEATPGDLMITVNSRNLNGDVDIFTAVTFRPLMKVSIYANTIPPEVSKSIYFRTRQILILRVEARTPNDDPGAYRITFSGSFQPFSGGIPVAENTEPPPESEAARPGKARRLSSVGATIEGPPAETKPEETKPEETKPAEAATEKPREAAPKKSVSPRSRNTTGRVVRPRPSRTPRAQPKPETAKTEPPKKESEEEKPAVKEEEKTETEKPPAQKPAPQELPGPHLIIEQKDGTRIDRPMSTVRRVVIDNGAIVIILKTGRIERVPMSAVERMAIEP